MTADNALPAGQAKASNLAAIIAQAFEDANPNILVFRSIDVDETEEEVKATAGNLYGFYFYNKAASIMYLKFYNATAANVTVGTTTPWQTFPLGAGQGALVSFDKPLPFSTALCVAATTGIADSDTGAPAANDVTVNLYYV